MKQIFCVLILSFLDTWYCFQLINSENSYKPLEAVSLVAISSTQFAAVFISEQTADLYGLIMSNTGTTSCQTTALNTNTFYNYEVSLTRLSNGYITVAWAQFQPSTSNAELYMAYFSSTCSVSHVGYIGPFTQQENPCVISTSTYSYIVQTATNGGTYTNQIVLSRIGYLGSSNQNELISTSGTYYTGFSSYAQTDPVICLVSSNSTETIFGIAWSGKSTQQSSNSEIYFGMVAWNGASFSTVGSYYPYLITAGNKYTCASITLSTPVVIFVYSKVAGIYAYSIDGTTGEPSTAFHASPVINAYDSMQYGGNTQGELSIAVFSNNEVLVAWGGKGSINSVGYSALSLCTFVVNSLTSMAVVQYPVNYVLASTSDVFYNPSVSLSSNAEFYLAWRESLGGTSIYLYAAQLCLSNAGCPSSAPSCVQFQCIKCTTSSQCLGSIGYSVKPICDTSGICVACAGNSECNTAFPAQPLCASSGACYNCTNSGQCHAGYPSTPICVSSVCHICTQNSECSSISSSLPFCLSNGTCSHCISNSECLSSNSSAPICLSSGACVPCTSNSECSGTTPICITGSCSACAYNSECEGISAATPFCHTQTGACLPCSSNSECGILSSTTPLCSSNGTCVECTSNSECYSISSISPICQTDGACLPCTTNAQCKTWSINTPVCKANGSCIPCASNTECNSINTIYPYCRSSGSYIGACVNCVTNSECLAKSVDTPVCNSQYECAACTSNTECFEINAAKAICSNDECIPCTSSSQCESISGYPYCQKGSCVSQSETVIQAETIATTSTATTSIVSSGSVGAQIASPGSSGTVSRPLYLNMFIYLRYLEIPYPEFMVQTFNTSHTSQVGVPIPSLISDSTYPAPQRFRQYGASGLFIINFWTHSLTVGGIVTLTIIILFIDFCIKKSSMVILQRLSSAIEEFFVWNFVLSIYLTTIGDSSLFMTIELQSLKEPIDTLAAGSLILDLSILIVTCLIWGMVLIPKSKLIFTQLEGNSENEAFLPQMLQRFKIIYQDYKVEKPSQLYYLFLLSGRVFLFGLIVGGLNSPVTQLILFMLLNIGMLGYLIKVMPCKKFIRNFEYLFNETCLLALNGLTMGFIVIDSPDSSSANKLGNYILMIDLAMMIATGAFTAIEFLITVYQALQKFFQDRNKLKIRPINKAKNDLVRPAEEYEENPPLSSKYLNLQGNKEYNQNQQNYIINAFPGSSLALQSIEQNTGLIKKINKKRKQNFSILNAKLDSNDIIETGELINPTRSGSDISASNSLTRFDERVSNPSSAESPPQSLSNTGSGKSFDKHYNSLFNRKERK